MDLVPDSLIQGNLVNLLCLGFILSGIRAPAAPQAFLKNNVMCAVCLE